MFSFGSILWELATSRIPFSGLPDNLAVIRAELNKPEPKLARLGYAVVLECVLAGMHAILSVRPHGRERAYVLTCDQ